MCVSVTDPEAGAAAGDQFSSSKHLLNEVLTAEKKKNNSNRWSLSEGGQVGTTYHFMVTSWVLIVSLYKLLHSHCK